MSYATTDIGTASYLMCKGFRVQEIRRLPGKAFRCEFIFGPEAAAEADKSFIGGASVDARQLMTEQRSLRGRLRGLRQGGRYNEHDEVYSTYPD